MAVTYFSGSIKLIWIFNTYIPDGAEKVTRKGNFPDTQRMTCLKIQVPLPEKYVRAEPALYRRRKQKVSFEIIIPLRAVKPLLKITV